MDQVSHDAFTVLLPAFSNTAFTEESKLFFNSGGVATLLGSTREEYVARRMSHDREIEETQDQFLSYSRRARALAGNVLLAVDYELGGVHRLHRLGPQLSHPREALEMKLDEIEVFGTKAACAAKSCGINFFLAPVIDLVTGKNPWLRDRTFSTDPGIVSAIAKAFIRGVQHEGVVATAKHFPGHPHVPVDPFDSATVTITASLSELTANFQCFDAVIAAGVQAIMTGPIPIDAIDPSEPASSSAKVIARLRKTHQFSGLIVSDDIDLPGTLRGRSVPDVAVTALKAGVELLLLASGPQVQQVAGQIVRAVEAGELEREVLSQAARKVRSLASNTKQE
jgi:beta-N-acetylhexosaminidase